MSTFQIIDALSELSIYATIFVGNKEYTDKYNKVCRKIKDIHEHYPVNEMNWTEEKKGYK